MKVFIIEDDVRYRGFLTKLLADKFGFEVNGGENNISGLKNCITFKPDLIFIDVSLPGLTGESSLKKLRSVEEMRIIPVIVLTSNIEKSVAARLIKMGVKDFMMKVYERDETKHRLNKILQSIGLISNIKKEEPENGEQAKETVNDTFFIDNLPVLEDSLEKALEHSFSKLGAGNVNLTGVKGLNKLHDQLMLRSIIRVEEEDVEFSLSLISSKNSIRYLSHSLDKGNSSEEKSSGVDFLKEIHQKYTDSFLQNLKKNGMKVSKEAESVDLDADTFISKRWKSRKFFTTEQNLFFFAGIHCEEQ